MKGKNVAIALIFLGIGAFIGMAFGRASGPSWVLNRGDRVKRVVIQDGLRGEGREEIVVEIPEIPDIPPIPEMPPIPNIRMHPPETIVERGTPSIGIFSLVREIIRWVGNLLALLLIVVGAALIMRQRNQPAEKAPPVPTPKTE